MVGAEVSAHDGIGARAEAEEEVADCLLAAGGVQVVYRACPRGAEVDLNAEEAACFAECQGRVEECGFMNVGGEFWAGRGSLLLLVQGSCNNRIL